MGVELRGNVINGLGVGVERRSSVGVGCSVLFFFFVVEFTKVIETEFVSD